MITLAILTQAVLQAVARGAQAVARGAKAVAKVCLGTADRIARWLAVRVTP